MLRPLNYPSVAVFSPVFTLPLPLSLSSLGGLWFQSQPRVEPSLGPSDRPLRCFAIPAPPPAWAQDSSVPLLSPRGSAANALALATRPALAASLRSLRAKTATPTAAVP